MAVNDELGELERVLPECVNLLQPGGRLAIISFHSLEDRLVKNFFKNTSVLKVVTKRPVTATREEIAANPRSRSAKLRVAEKI
jgi:16S rRNA (cytosine1402-N4)-methyltransferase